MMNFTIEAALKSGIAEQVYVSTEDQEIGRIAEQAGAVYHPRPIALAGDLVSATDVCLEVEQSLSRRSQVFDAIVCLQPTSPFRNAQDIRNSWNRFVETGADFLVSVTAVDPHYFHWAVHESPDGWAMFFGDRFMVERPLLPPVYRPNGAVKIGKVDQLKAIRNFFGSRLEVYEMPESRSLHVGERSDLELALYFMNSEATRFTEKVK